MSPAAGEPLNVLVRPFGEKNLIAALDLAYIKWMIGLAKGRRRCRALNVPPVK